MRSAVILLSERYRGAIRFVLIQQAAFAGLCLLLLDGGRMARVCGVAMLGFWTAAGLIMARRPNAPARGDIAYLCWGFWPLFALAAVLARFV